MTYEELLSATLDVYACNSNGCRCNSHVGELAHIRTHIQSHSGEAHRRLVARLVIDFALSDEALGQGYGPEDASEFLKWLDDEGVLIP